MLVEEFREYRGSLTEEKKTQITGRAYSKDKDGRGLSLIAYVEIEDPTIFKMGNTALVEVRELIRVCESVDPETKRPDFGETPLLRRGDTYLLPANLVARSFGINSSLPRPR